MPGKRILVTGAAGFLGRNILTSIGAGFDTTGLDILPRPAGLDHDWLHLSLENIDKVNVLRGFDTVVHSAWTGFPNYKASTTFSIEHNVLPTVELFEACAEAGVRRMVFFSSGGTVYGNPARLPVLESDPLAPVSPYGASKVSAEAYLRAMAVQMPVDLVILRIANPYGPGQMPWRGQGAIPTLIGCALTGATFRTRGSLDVQRDYVFIDDVSAAVAAVLGGVPGSDVFNVGSGVGTSLGGLVRAVEEVTGLTIDRSHDPALAADASDNVLSVERLQSRTGWAPDVTLHDGIGRAHAWMAANRGLWESLVPAG